MWASSSAAIHSDERIAPNVSRLVAAVSRYTRARLRLLGVEGKEALGHFGAIAGLGVAALVAFLFAYVFLCLTITFALARAFGGGQAWLWVSAGMALVHLLVAGVSGFVAWKRLRRPVFGHSLEELRKDEEWLHR